MRALLLLATAASLAAPPAAAQDANFLYPPRLIEDRLPVRLNLQLHKFVWSPNRRGV